MAFYSRSIAKTSDEELYDALKELTAKRDILFREEKGPHELHGFMAFGVIVSMIFINNDMPTYEKACTLAHELGHYMLHRNSLASLLYDTDREYHGLIEQQADAYGERLIRLLSKRLALNTLEYPDLKLGNKHPRKSA